MAYYDVFNGDADGICALQQLRLAEPREAELITGLKRDINLLAKVSAQAGDQVTVLDISLEKNLPALLKNLEQGAEVLYADHHYPGVIPEHENLTALIDVAADTCTSLIIDQYLEHSHWAWAVVGAYGDNFDEVASELARSNGLSELDQNALQTLGVCLNYNGYGFDLSDLFYHPVELYAKLHPYQNPVDFLTDEAFKRLLFQYQEDIDLSSSSDIHKETKSAAMFFLPNQSWARRVVGVMGNDIAKQYPDRAHALLIDMGDGHYRVSVRAPYNNKLGADDLCRQFESGGGRKAAAGINSLSENLLESFTDKFFRAYQSL
jgi:hypothetical protein